MDSSPRFKRSRYASCIMQSQRISQVLDLQDKHNASFNMYGLAETNPMAKIEKRSNLQTI